MNATIAAGTAVAAVSPLRDRSRKRRLVKVGGWVAVVALLLVVLNLLGVDVHGWLTHLWDQLKAVPVGYLVAGAAALPTWCAAGFALP